jgi:hypothetical protein
LVSSGELSDAALKELTIACRAIAGALPNPRAWNRPSPWKGLIVGAVQSGKTQNMMGVTAVALDAGYRIIVVLAGMKDDLREQTARRFNTQLLLQNDFVPGTRRATTLGGQPGHRGKMHAYAAPYNLDCHENSVLLAKLSGSLREGLPAVIVVKKLPTSLNDLRGALAAAYEEFGPETLPTLVLDDECDEASVPGGGTSEERAIPEGITNLWQGFGVHPWVCYLGYTATAAANLLQDPEWPLYPHFVWLLRYSGPENSELKYEEPTCDRWYSGGDCFYEEFADIAEETANFLVSPRIDPRHLDSHADENPSLLDAFRAYFVGGAYRLALAPERSFATPACLPEPHSMMIHTSAAQEDHSRWLDGVLRLFGSRTLADGGIGLSPERLSNRARSEESLWKAWHDRFTAARDRIYDTRPHLKPYSLPSWQEVQRLLSPVFEYVRIKVVNSNAARGDSLCFEPSVDSEGHVVPPPDIYVIAIGGSRLSRGITVKGLGVSYFARWATQRHEDTIQQMSRWFGYRGPYLEFCRLFTTPDAYDGLREMNSNDTSLRVRLSQLMKEGRDPAYAAVVFRASPYVRPTAKLGAGKIHNLTFSPFSKVLASVRYGSLDAANEKAAERLVAELRKRGATPVFTDSHVQRGILSRNWSAEEVADILDRLQFENHNPADEANLLGGEFRSPDPSRPVVTGIDAESDPYHIAAYLRRWSREPCDGGRAPLFNVGVSFGEMTEACEPFDFPLLNRQISADDRVKGGWTSRGPNWPGDFYFDRIAEELKLGKMERARGAPGLLLLHVIHRSAIGRTERGKVRAHHTPFFGIAIPAGGPDEIRVVTKTKEVGQ